METLNIETSQNIDIEHSIASIGERIAATLLDILFFAAYYIVVALVFRGFQSSAIFIVASLPIAFYSIACELFLNGQSLGKKILKIRVVKIDGSSITFSSFFLRWITRIIEVYTMIGSLATITLILNRKGQRLGDIAANTTVIRLKNKSLHDTVFMQIPENYILVYPDVSKLSSGDIYTIKEVIEFMKSPKTNDLAVNASLKLRNSIERKLNISSNQDTLAFFQTLMCDYNYINSRI